MKRRGWLTVSLARKISLLFGTAVLLTIAATLLFPWLQMTWLDDQALLMKANWVATTAYLSVDIDGPDWHSAQQELTRSWPILVRELGMPNRLPKLVPAGPFVGPGFQTEAIENLRASPRKKYYWRSQHDRRVFRFALAVRGTSADPHPHVLRGIIDVRLDVPQSAGAWNSIVTILAGASGAVLAILVFYMVSQRLVLSPLHSLRRAAQQVATGDLHVRSAITSGDEFQQLSHSYVLVHSAFAR